MNYTAKKYDCKALLGVALLIFSAFLFTVRAYADDYDVVRIPNFWLDGKYVYVAKNVSPRSSSLTSVTISYDSLSDLVYYCNEHGLSTTLAYNTSMKVYVGFVSSKALDVSKFGTTTLHGLLCNSAGKVYIAERPATGGNSTTNNTYNFNQTIINNPGGSAGSSPGYGGTVSSSTTDRKLQEDIYFQTWYIGEYISILVGWTKIIEDEVYGIYQQIDDNVVPALSSINKNLISFKDSTVSNLNALYTITEYDYVTSLSQLDVLNRLYSGVTSIDSRLDSVILNGAVQVNTSSIDARLDKLISMYSKVNSVVLDTAAVNGGQIKSAVGGELMDVMFWGNAKRQNPYLLTSPLNYSLSGAPVSLGAPELRSIPLGSSIPSYVSADPVLAAGVWKSGSTYYLSDTYNAVTGEYVQRIKSIVFDGSESWGRSIRADGASLIWLSCMPDNAIAMPMWSSRYVFSTYTSAFDLADDSTKTITSGHFSHYGKYVRFMDTIGSLDNWKTWLSNKYKAGEPLEIWYALAGESVTTYLDLRPTIAIPEGDSSISADRLRVTAVYETYDSYTQQADIINAINNIPPYDDSAVVAAIVNLESTLSKPAATVTADLTEVTSRLDTLIENSASKVENTTINITNDNDAFNVFYITDDNGESQPVTEFAGDLAGASGKFLSMLYRLVFSDALNNADSDLGSFEDFFTSTEPPQEDTVTQSANGISEEVDVWLTF